MSFEIFLDLISYLWLNLALNLCYILGTYFHKKVLASILHPITYVADVFSKIFFSLWRSRYMKFN